VKVFLLAIILSINVYSKQENCTPTPNELKKLTDLSKEFNKQIEKAKEQLKIELRMP
jgi:uncharacterized membrane protein (DUF106 family)